eukprot:9478409-Pyramimonas_sp.AAC.7
MVRDVAFNQTYAGTKHRFVTMEAVGSYKGSLVLGVQAYVLATDDVSFTYYNLTVTRAQPLAISSLASIEIMQTSTNPCATVFEPLVWDAPVVFDPAVHTYTKALPHAVSGPNKCGLNKCGPNKCGLNKCGLNKCGPNKCGPNEHDRQNGLATCSSDNLRNVHVTLLLVVTVEDLTFIASPTHEYATMDLYLDGKLVEKMGGSGGRPQLTPKILLPIAKNVFTVVVTAEDGITTTKYTFNLERITASEIHGAPPATPGRHRATVLYLSASDMNITPTRHT